MPLKTSHEFYYQKALQAVEQGNFHAAELNINLALRKCRDNENYLITKAKILIKDFKLEQAHALLSQMIASNSLCFRALLERSYIRANYLDDVEGAIFDLKTAMVASDLNSEIPYCRLAEIYLSQERYQDAFRELSVALRINPTSFDALRLQGKTFIAQNDLNSAAEAFSSAINAGCTDADVYLDLAEAYTRLHNIPLAINTYSLMLQNNISDNLMPIYVKRGRLNLLNNSFKFAFDDFSAALAACPPGGDSRATILFMRGIASRFLEDYEGAVADFDQCMATDGFIPDTADLYYHRGYCLFKIGDLPMALRDLDHALEIKRIPQIYLARGTALYQMKRLNAAQNDLSRGIDLIKRRYSLKLDQTDFNFVRMLPKGIKKTLSDLLLKRAECLSGLNLGLQAIDDFTGCITLNFPHNIRKALIGRAEAFRNLERANEALTDFSAAINLSDDASSSDNCKIFRGCAQCFKLLGDADNALSNIDKAIASCSDNVLMSDLLLEKAQYIEQFSPQEKSTVFDLCTDSISVNPQNYQSYIKRACVSFELNRPEITFNDAQFVLSKIPDDKNSIKLRIAAAFKMNNYDDAFKYCDTAIAMFPDDKNIIRIKNKMLSLRGKALKNNASTNNNFSPCL